MNGSFKTGYNCDLKYSRVHIYIYREREREREFMGIHGGMNNDCVGVSESI